MSQQGHAQLKLDLDKQTLQNQLLEQTVQGEILKKQLQQLQGAPNPVSANVTFITGAPHGQVLQRSPTISPPVAMKKNGHIMVGGQRIPGEIDESRPGGVRTLKHTFEKQIHSALDMGMFAKEAVDYCPPNTVRRWVIILKGKF